MQTKVTKKNRTYIALISAREEGHILKSYMYPCNSIFIDLSFLEEKNRILEEQQRRQRIEQQNRLGRNHSYQPFNFNRPPTSSS